MNPYEILERWKRWYPESVPVGHLLRGQHPDRWLRIYSLPGGKRYPETGSDWTELLNRQTRAADVVLGRHSACILIAAYLGDWPDSQAFSGRYQLEVLALIREDFPQDGSDPEEHGIDLWWAPVTWDPAALEPALRLRAEDRGPAFLLVALSSGHVFAPYDGGVDLFAPHPGTRSEFRAALRPWVSPRGDGL